MKKLAIVLIIIGIIFLLMPTITEQIVKYQINKAETLSVNVDDIKKNNEAEGEFDYEAIKDIDINTVFKGSLDNSNELVVGYIAAPSIGMELPILKGVTDSNLMKGATTMKPDQKLGQGNYSLAGHYMKRKDLLFGGLMDMQVGDIVSVTDLENVYEYEIYENKIVPDDALYMIEDSQADQIGEPVISLMTCYYSSKSEKRFFSNGKLINVYEYEDN